MPSVTLKAIEGLLDEKLENFVTKTDFHDSFNTLLTSVDNIAKDVKDIKQELPILHAGQERIKTVLVEKLVATADELSIQRN